MELGLDEEQQMVAQTIRRFADGDLRGWAADADRSGTPKRLTGVDDDPDPNKPRTQARSSIGVAALRGARDLSGSGRPVSWRVRNGCLGLLLVMACDDKLAVDPWDFTPALTNLSCLAAVDGPAPVSARLLAVDAGNRRIGVLDVPADGGQPVPVTGSPFQLTDTPSELASGIAVLLP
jgi:alkylation response protein AidB-like acyl-CoA dehydrogenase